LVDCLVAAADERMKLEEILAITLTTIGELQSGLLIVSPWLADASVVPPTL
jgi:hypothetical protein